MAAKSTKTKKCLPVSLHDKLVCACAVGKPHFFAAARAARCRNEQVSGDADGAAEAHASSEQVDVASERKRDGSEGVPYESFPRSTFERLPVTGSGVEDLRFGRGSL